MLGVASLVTLGILLGFVAVIVLLIMYYGGQIDALTVLISTVVINLVLWLIAPFFMELVYRIFYKSKKITLEELRLRSNRVSAFIEKTCQKYRFPVPRLFLIQDDNPTAFVFGSAAFNARLVFSEGLFTYLDEEEMESVIAHELGHIRRRDFIIMTIASTLVQILFELAHILMKSSSKRSGKKGGQILVLIGLVSYVFYFISTYMLLYLSRTREYGADKFSAEETGNPDALARALIKIAYGIIAKPDSASEERLLKSTRALGIFDHQAAKHLGGAFQNSQKNWGFIAKVLFYDLISPWAKILELASTHPLTGKRIAILTEMTLKQGRTPSIDIEAVKKTPVDREKLYRGFTLGIFIYFLPSLAILAALISGLINPVFIAFIPAAAGLALLIKLAYKYPSGTAEKVTTLEAMSDLYASPVRGRLIELQGQVIGKGQAGSYLSEDMMFQDNVGLLYLNYESAIPIIGNLIFGFSKIKKLLGQPAIITGWFLRGVSHHLDLKTFNSKEKNFKSHPILWSVIGAILAIAASLYLFLMAAAEISKSSY